jgi:hypothetical protein
MDGPFVVRLALTFVVGGLWVAGATALAERAGTKIGGWASGLPSTVVVALFFIGLSQTPHAAAEAALMVPLTAGLNGLYLASFVRLSRRGFARGLAIALMIWFSAAAVLSRLQVGSLGLSIIGWAAATPAACLLLRKETLRQLTGGAKTGLVLGMLASRALAGGVVVAAAVAAARLSGPLLGGIFAAFPGVFSSTILVAYRSNGLDFARAIAKPMMFSGLINVAVYGAAVHLAYPSFGLAAGTAMAFGISMISALLVFRILARSS